MARLKHAKQYLVVWLLFFTVLAGCSIDTHVENTVKIEDPFAGDDDQHFIGLVVSFLALPHGESTYVRFPNGKKLLIDTGSADDAETLREQLADRKITKIDYVVLTNDQPAYSGGYASLAENVKIDTVLMPKEIAPSIRSVVPIQADTKLVYLSEGDHLGFDQHVSLTVLHPGGNLSLSPQDNSLVFQLRHDKLRFLFTSGISETAEERLLTNHAKELQSEVLKVAQQGTNQASSQPFLSAVDPQVAVIETGQTKAEMKTEQAEILERLSESWAETYTTSHSGTVTILSNGKDYRVLKKKNQ